MVALEYGAIGALAGANLGKLSAANRMFFLPMIDAGIIQNPMFRSGAPADSSGAVPRIRADAAGRQRLFRIAADVGIDLLLSGAWIVVLALAVAVVLRSAIGTSR